MAESDRAEPDRAWEPGRIPDTEASSGTSLPLRAEAVLPSGSEATVMHLCYPIFRGPGSPIAS